MTDKHLAEAMSDFHRTVDGVPASNARLAKRESAIATQTEVPEMPTPEPDAP